MLTSDGRAPKRSNAHAHVEARAATGRTSRAVAQSNAHARVHWRDSLLAARGANLALPTEGWPAAQRRMGGSLENAKDRIF